MQLRGPEPKGKYVKGWIVCLFSEENLSGSNFSGFGKYSGSLCNPTTGIRMTSPFLIRYFFPPGESTSS